MSTTFPWTFRPLKPKPRTRVKAKGNPTLAHLTAAERANLPHIDWDGCPLPEEPKPEPKAKAPPRLSDAEIADLVAKHAPPAALSWEQRVERAERLADVEGDPNATWDQRVVALEDKLSLRGHGSWESRTRAVEHALAK